MDATVLGRKLGFEAFARIEQLPTLSLSLSLFLSFCISAAICKHLGAAEHSVLFDEEDGSLEFSTVAYALKVNAKTKVSKPSLFVTVA